MAKAKKRDRLKKMGEGIQGYFNVRAWAGADQISNPLKFLKGILVTAFVLPESDEVEKDDFHAVIQKMGLTEEVLKKRQSAFLKLCIIMILLGLLTLGYTIYHLIGGHYRVSFCSLVLVFVCLSFAFRYHFWYFQLRMRRLGCTFKEWYNYVFLRKK